MNHITKFCNTVDEIIEAVANAWEGDVISVHSGTYEFIGVYKIVFSDKRKIISFTVK